MPPCSPALLPPPPPLRECACVQRLVLWVWSLSWGLCGRAIVFLPHHPPCRHSKNGVRPVTGILGVPLLPCRARGGGWWGSCVLPGRGPLSLPCLLVMFPPTPFCSINACNPTTLPYMILFSPFNAQKQPHPHDLHSTPARARGWFYAAGCETRVRDKHSNGAKGAKQSLETRREAPLPALALAAGMKQKRGMHIADKKKHEPFPRDPRGGRTNTR